MIWEERRFDELGFIGRGRSRHRPRNDESLYGGNYPMIQTGEVKAANFYINSFTQTYNEKGLSQSKLWSPNTLCITIAANIAETAILDIEACFPDSIIGFVPYDDESDVRFVKYYFDVVKLQMQKISQGATQDNLSLGKLLTFKVPTPPLAVQKKIASILSAYDDLIENNLKCIQLLEEVAQHLYKEWFVNFRFPGNGEIKFDNQTGLPEDWVQKPFSEVAEYLNGFAFKPKHHSNTGLPVIKIKELKNGISVSTPRNSGEDIPEKYHFDNNAIIFSWSADLNVYWWSNGKALLNQHLFKVTPKEGIDKEYFFYSLKAAIPQFKNKANGATMKHIKRKELENVYFVQPTAEIVSDFSKLVKPILTQLNTLTEQNQKLKEARDLLLPRLMNRTIEV